MSIRRLIFFLLVAVAFLIATGIPTNSQNSDQGIIVGRNVNMVSGTEFAKGDPYLQRQNEPSIAVSTRNPLHLLAGANDYRTIDVPYQDELPGIPEGTAARDAWLGVFKSIDGGQSWTSTLLPGYPQDTSIEGTSSPISGYDAACDPVVRAGTNGLFYYSGIAFNRAERGAGVVFVARFIDNNNIEGSDAIEYVDTHIVDQGNAGQFLDMPSIAVDIPRNMTNTGMIRTAGDLPQNIPCGNVYITYTVFLGNTIENVRSRILFAMSTDCGANWSKPIKVSESQHILQRTTIVIDPSDPTGSTIYLAFRRFTHGKNLDAIVIVKSVDGGQTFTKPIEVATFDPFDQGTSTYSFRSNSYPTLTVDGGGIVYLAWAQRIGGPDGFARIVIKTSPDGINWPSPAVEVDDSAEARGHQFMPSLTYAGGKLMIAWYDQRDDLACLADPTDPNKYFTKYIEDSMVRHTIDVRVALIEPGLTPLIYPSERVSRYLHILELDESGDWIEDPPGSGFAKVQQAEFNPPNYTLFQLGTVPFYGDWLEIVPSTPLLNSTSGMSQAPSFHVVWTDNRDVRPPGGNWWVFPWPTSNYNAPDSGHNRVDCLFGDLTGVRNQNIYTASITSGILVGSLGNTKPADDVQHTYIIFVKNTTSGLRSFRLTVDASNASFRQNIVEHRLPTLDVEVPPYSTVTRTVFVDPPQTQIRIDVVEIDEPGGSVIPDGLTAYILLNPDPTNPPVYDPYNPGQFLYYEYHNPRVENPRVENYDLTDAAEMNPRVLNPRVENPRVLNPRVLNPRVENLGLLNPRVENISFLNPEMENPRVENPRVENTAMADVVWEVGNEGNTTSIYTLTMLSEAVQYDEQGNPYIPDEKIFTQILVYKIHTTPATTPEDDCILGEEHSDELLLNITNPRVENPRVWNPRVENPRVENPRVENPRVENATFALAPGEEAYVIWRIWDDETPSTAASGGLRTASTGGLSIGDIIGPVDEEGVPEDAGAALSAHAANTVDVLQDVYDPPVSMSANVAPIIGHSPSSLDFTALVGGPEDSKDLDIENTGEGILDYTLSIEYDSGAGWLSLDSYEGQSTAGDPANLHVVTVHPAGLSEGTYEADIVIEAVGALNSPQRVQVTLTIASVGLLDHFELDPIGNQTEGVAFPITITAKDSNGNTVTGYTGSNTLSDTTGTINPTTVTFTAGVWTGDVTISTVQPGVTITTTGDTKTSVSNSFDVIIPPLSITTEELPPGIADGVSGCGYYPPAEPGDPPVKLEATGGTPPYTWSIAGSNFPPGLTLSSGTGEITGVPEYESGATYPKEYMFNVQVTDSTPQSVTKPLSITVDLPPLGIGTPGLPDGVIGQVYAASALIADCAIGNLNWEILAGGEFPPGLALNGSTGLISGSPELGEVSYPYTYNFTVKVTDSVGSRTASKPLSITIAEPLEITTPSTLPYGVAGVLYSPVTLSATGGIQPYQWPPGPLGGPGLSIDSNGVISGTPTTVGVHQGVVVEVHDSASPEQWASKQFNIVIHEIAPQVDLVSWWPGDNNAFDYINGNHGTLYEGTTYAGGMVEDAFSFDGVDDYVLATGAGINNLDVFTIEMWVHLNSLQDDIDRFVTIGPPGCPKACLRHEAGGTGMLHFYMCIDSTIKHIWVDGVLQTGCWHHVAGTYDGSVMRVYLDGVEVGNLPVTGTVATGNDEVYIGYPNPGQPSHEVLDGLLDEVKIYSRALEASEIQAIYEAGDPNKICAPPGPTTKIAFASNREGNFEIYIMNPDGSGLQRLTNHAEYDVQPSLSPDGNKIAFASRRYGTFEICVINTDGSGLTRLTDNIYSDVQPSWSPDGSKIAFASSRDGDIEIYVMNADGSGQTRLTANSSAEEYPTWSPNGSKIAFTSSRDGDIEIYVMNADGSEQTNLTNDPEYDNYPSWSPDGSKIAFSSTRDGGGLEIYVMNADGSEPTPLTATVNSNLEPSWSPDGNKIAFTSTRDGQQEIYVMNADGTGQTNLTDHLDYDGYPSWGGSPVIAFMSLRDGNWEIYVMNGNGTGQTNLTNNTGDDNYPSWRGSKIAFTSYRDENYEIYVMNADGSEQTNKTSDPTVDNYPSWSPDGSKIAFMSSRTGNGDIYIMDADGTNVTQLTTHLMPDTFPSWSPDGSKIVFQSNRDGNDEIYVMNADGTGQTNLTDNSAYDSEPSWSSDGSKITFTSNRDGNLEIYVMNADGTGQTNKTNNPANDSEPSWSSDGIKITFTSNRDGNLEIYVMNADGTNVSRLTTDSAWDRSPCWRTQITITTYTISGAVTEGGSGLQGVTMTGLPGTPTPTTDSNGDYSGTVNHGWSGTVTPTLAGYTFSPSSRTYSNVTTNQIDQDYTPTAITPAPEIWRSPSSMTFEAAEGGANPSSQTLEVKNSGGDTLSYTITDGAGWLSVLPESGTSTGDPASTHTVSVDISGLSAASSPYNATITITAPGASNTPQTVSVTLTIYYIMLDESNAAKWFGGDNRLPPFSPRNAGVGQSIILPSECYISSVGFKFGGRFDYDYDPDGFGHEVTLVLNVRSSDGTITKAVEKVVPAEFDGGWVDFDIEDNLSAGKYIFTCYLVDGEINHYCTGVLGHTDNTKLPNSDGYGGGIKPGEDIEDWAFWITWAWDFNFRMAGTGLVAHYSFNGDASDASGNGNHGTVYGGATYSEDWLGNPNGAIVFDGVDDYVELPNESNFDLTTWSIVAVVKVPNYSRRNPVISKGDNFGNYTLHITPPDGKPYITFQVSTGNSTHWLANEAVPINQFVHIAATYNYSTRQLRGYINGIPKATITTTYTPLLNNGNATIGLSPFPYPTPTEYFIGTIDDIRIYNRVLSESEIESLYLLNHETYEFITKWGSEGTGNGEFNQPYGIAVDSSGYVYVADFSNSCVQKFTSSGTFETKWGINGTGNGEFNLPSGIAVDSSGYVYVADTGNNRVQKFDSNGSFVTKWGNYGTEDGQFNLPYGIAVDSSGYVYVADTGSHRVQKFSSTNGINYTFVAKWGSNGTGDGEFNQPYGIAVDSSGYVYVADCYNHRVQKFTSNGSFVTKWGSNGTGDGQFKDPRGIAVDSSGYVYVVDYYNYRVQKFTSNGSFVTKWGSNGTGDGQFYQHYGIAVDSSGYVYVVDAGNHRVQKFKKIE